MKLRQLELGNVRRFAGQTARLGPFGDGLTTITAENEAGKSTFFDALHALFFVPYGSSSQEIKGLQPYSGGAVRIAAVVDIDGKIYQIEKSFLLQKSARVIALESGQVIKQQGDAEAWIEDNINGTGKGPAGLLWVRQGAAHIDPEGKDKDASNIAARRDLMSSVRGQIDAVTGGRRMDRIVERCRAELDALATKTLKAKAGSAWKALEDKIAELLEQKERLQTDVRLLSQALAVKRQAKSRLYILRDPSTHEAREAQLTLAAQSLEMAQQHERIVTDAERALRLIVAEKDRLIQQSKEISERQARRSTLLKQAEQQARQVSDLRAAQGVSQGALQKAQEAIAQKEAARRSLVQALSAARKTEKSFTEWQRLRAVFDIRQSLVEPQQNLRAAQESLECTKVTQSDLDHLVDLGRRISVAHEQRRVQFARFSVQPSLPVLVECAGAPLEPGEERLIDRALTLDLPGFGAIKLAPAPGAGQSIEDPSDLVAQQRDAMQLLSVQTVQEARVEFYARQSAEHSQAVAIAEIRGLVPDGIAALEAEWRALCEALGHGTKDSPPVLESPGSGQLAAREIEEKIARVDDGLEHARSDAQALQSTAMRCANDFAEASGVLSHLEKEVASSQKPQNEDAVFAALQASCDETNGKEARALQALEQLRRGAPDLEGARASHERLLSAQQADSDEINRLERELARVNGAIETQSEAAVEEKLAEVIEQLAKARDRAKRYELQAQALSLLIAHLAQARTEAQETYFEPIRRELRPLLAQLHTGVEFELDPEKMLVSKIVRNGVEDDVAVLSGGAYEQIAILTRLAFAKLFAKQGRQVPLILDDALVHTDDERISTMFNMLSQAAKDQQIIVLSCRTKAFSDLGGTRAFIEIEPT